MMRDYHPRLQRGRSRLGICLAGCLMALALTGCDTVRVAETRRPVLYEDYPPSLLNSSRVSRETAQVAAGDPLAKDGVRTFLASLAIAKPGRVTASQRIAAAELCLDAARKRRAKKAHLALGFHLAAAEQAWHGLRIAGLEPGQERLLRGLYNLNTGQVATLLYPLVDDWNRSIKIRGPLQAHRIDTESGREGLMNPATFEALLPADHLRVEGFRTRVFEDGFGAAMVAHRDATRERYTDRSNLDQLGVSLPLTATLEFRENSPNATLRFHDTSSNHRQIVGTEERDLSADYTAATAVPIVSHDHFEFGFRGTLRPNRFNESEALLLLEPPRKNEIPVILVHGLLATPTTWKDTYNELFEDPRIRENFQIWFYVYPAGNPIAYTAARFRKRLNEMMANNPAFANQPSFDRIVLVGHSMGGIVSNFQTRTSGDDIWFRFFDKPVDALDIDETTREALRSSVYFEPQENVERAVFIAAPHRGSPLALNPLARMAARLIEAPFELLALKRPELLTATTELGEAIFEQGVNGVSGLQASGPVLELLLERPTGDGITYHTIVGDRGLDSPPETRSDGIVPYWSSRLDTVASEKIVPSGHNAHQHPETVEEIKRILLEHLEAR